MTTATIEQFISHPEDALALLKEGLVSSEANLDLFHELAEEEKAVVSPLGYWI